MREDAGDFDRTPVLNDLAVADAANLLFQSAERARRDHVSRAVFRQSGRASATRQNLRLHVPADTPVATGRPIRAEARTELPPAIAKGRQWLADLSSCMVAEIETIAEQEGLSERSARMRLSLAFLATDIVHAAVDGTLPRGFGVSRLTDLPADWTKQRKALGLAVAS